MPFSTVVITSSEHYHRLIPIPFLVDTGSPWTMISPNDATLLDIPIEELRMNDEYQKVGCAGYSCRRLLMKNTGLKFTDETGETVYVKMPELSVLDPVKKVPSNELKELRSIIGCDFLINGKFALYFNPSMNRAYFKKDIDA